MAEEEDLKKLVEAHRERFGRLDVLVNNAGVGIGEAMHELTTKYVDMQLGVNLRALILMTRECLPMLREAGTEHGKALIVNTASIAGKAGQPWLSVYSATKAAVIGFSQATQKEVAGQGIQVTALAPGFVDTPMTEFVKEQVAAEEMIQPEDIAEAVRFLLRTSPQLRGAGDRLPAAGRHRAESGRLARPDPAVAGRGAARSGRRGGARPRRRSTRRAGGGGRTRRPRAIRGGRCRGRAREDERRGRGARVESREAGRRDRVRRPGARTWRATRPAP